MGAIVTGEIESVNLPDGSVFWSAGRVDILALPEGQHRILTPDSRALRQRRCLLRRSGAVSEAARPVVCQAPDRQAIGTLA